MAVNLVGLAVLVVAVVGALLASVGDAGSQDLTTLSGGSTVQDVGTLELFASDADGDGFDFKDTNGATAATEVFTTNNRSKLGETDLPQNLVTLTPNDGATNQTYVGLKDHTFGVRRTRRGQRDTGGPDQRKSNPHRRPRRRRPARRRCVVRRARTDVQVRCHGQHPGVRCDRSRRRPRAGHVRRRGRQRLRHDSGADRDIVRVPAEGEASRPFTGAVISIASPSDGAVSLIDDPGFETFFNIVENVSADLSIAKTVDDDTPDEGDTIIYTVTVTYESGNGPTTDLVVTDVLPAGVTPGNTLGDRRQLRRHHLVGLRPRHRRVGDPDRSGHRQAGTAGTTITNAATVTDTTEDNSNDSASAAITVNAVDLRDQQDRRRRPGRRGSHGRVHRDRLQPVREHRRHRRDRHRDPPRRLTFVSTNGCAEDPVGAPTCTLPDIPVLGSASV